MRWSEYQFKWIDFGFWSVTLHRTQQATKKSTPRKHSMSLRWSKNLFCKLEPKWILVMSNVVEMEKNPNCVEYKIEIDSEEIYDNYLLLLNESSLYVFWLIKNFELWKGRNHGPLQEQKFFKQKPVLFTVRQFELKKINYYCL